MFLSTHIWDGCLPSKLHRAASAVFPSASINFYYSKAHCLNLSGLVCQNTINQIFFKKQKFPTVQKAKSKITVLTDVKSGEGSFPHEWCILAVSSHVGCHEWWFCVLTCWVPQAVLCLFALFLKSVSVVHETPPWASHMQKSQLLNAFTLKTGFKTWIWGGHKH